MNRRNFSRELERIIEKQTEKPTLLLHSCCGPCSSSVLEYLVPHFKVSIFWYNPNIYPESEFDKRYDTLKELLEKMNLSGQVGIIDTQWRSDEYFSAVAGYENEPEGGARCERCFRLRLEECAKTAAELSFDYFASTLTVSRHKNAVLINAVGEEVAEKEGAVWLPSDFKKHDGENRSVELCELFHLYRQLYCGCKYSLLRRNNYEST
ncbi:MAG: epoxyqueuosine reductase QueH [Eubacteriales bacterium]|nr:epoxyqueuosine reductase QueH [Eubacteriales bacterium]